MPRPRKPTNILQLTGAFKSHADRARARANEPKPTGEIGLPPKHLSKEAASCWRELVRISHEGTLCKGDRVMLEYGSNLLAMLRARDWQVEPGLLIRLEAVLAKFGLTPADRSRVSVINPKDKATPYAEFARG